jgi:hypothetical protein
MVMVKKLNQMENKNAQILIVVLIASFVFLGACSAPNRDRIDSVSQTNQSITGLTNDQEFIPDTSINNKLFLNDENSIADFFIPHQKIQLVEFIKESPVAIFINQEQTQLLYAYQYEGSIKNSFSCFEINYTKNARSDKRENKVLFKNFNSGNDLHLGMSLDTLLIFKGRNYTVKNDTLIRYEINNFSKNPFLKRYNMPEYFLECKLKHERVIRIKFGFTRP